MTEQLKTLMHEQAESVTFDAPDLDAMAREGDRRRRTRAMATVAAGVAAAAVVGAVVVTSLGGSGGSRGLDPVGEPAAPAEVSWAFGQEIHVGDEVIDVGHDVRAYVRTSDGFVLTDPQGRVWSWNGDEVSSVGQTAPRQPRLFSDEESGRAAWVDISGDRPTLALLEGGDVRTVRFGANRLSEIYALDAGTAYLLDDRGAFALDLDSGRTTVLDPEADGDGLILDAENGLLAFNTPEEGGTAIGTRPVTGTGVQLPDGYGTWGRFSPDARWFSLEADEPKIYDARTGERVGFDVGRGFATGYEWLDDSTIAMLAAPVADTSAQAELITCTVPAASCETVAAQLGTFDDLVARGFALPMGEAIDD